MHARDFAALALSLLAIHLSLNHDGPVSLRKVRRKLRSIGPLPAPALSPALSLSSCPLPSPSTQAWYHHTPPDTVSALDGSPPYIPPPPLAVDLNGDGAVEVVVASADGHLAVLAPRPPAGKGAGFAPAPVLATASLAPAGPAVPGAEWRAVALAAGFLDPPPVGLGVAAPRRAVVLALTSGLEVVALDDRLRELWRAPLLSPGQAVPPLAGSLSHASIREAAILVTPHRLRPGDRGSVFVSASLRRGGGEAGGGAADAVAASLAADAAGGARGHAPPVEQEGEGPVRKADASDVAPDASHAPWHAAMAGQSGARRWTAGGPDGGGGSPPTNPPPSPLRRQHDVRLDAASVAAARAAADAAAGGACREFRAGVLSVLPHAWAGRGDTRVRLAHFAHRRAVGKAGAGGIGPNVRRVGELGRAGSTSSGLARAGGGGGNAVVAAAARAAAAAGRGAARAPGGMPPPPPPGASAATLAAWHATHKPNAVVVHTSGGLEVFHLHSGARVCGLKTGAPPGLTADLDGDGVPDYALAVSPAGHGARAAGGGDTAHDHARACEGVALGGLPPTHPLWNVSLCHHGAGGGGGGDDSLFGGGGGGDSGGLLGGGGASLAALAGVEAAPPARLALPRQRGVSGGPTRDTALVAFLVSSGEVTAVRGADGHVAWRRAVPGLDWRPHSLRASGAHPASPTLTAVALRPGGPPSALLAAGDRRVSLLSPAGHILASADLPGAPLLPLAAPADLDGDGLADVLCVTRDGVYGFSQRRRGGGAAGGGSGGLPLSALVGCLVAAMVGVWWTQQAGGRGVAKGGRATDRED